MSVERGQTKPKLRPPEDGIKPSGRPGPIAASWLETVSKIGDVDRMARGRTLARSQRVRDLWFAPGVAAAEVFDSEIQRVAIRVRCFSDSEWSTIRETLASRLTFIAGLLEGAYDRALVEALTAKGIALMPTAIELSADCDCADFMMPCAHVSAVHHILADALEGEPLLLFTLRGRDRLDLLSDLRAGWGDTAPAHDTQHAVEYPPPPAGDWSKSAYDTGSMTFHFAKPEDPCVGLHALGPAPENADMAHALAPLYAAGSTAALENVMQDDPNPPPQEQPMSPKKSSEASSGEDLAEAIVDLLAESDEGVKSKALAEALGVTLQDARTELLELEKLGIVYRTGQTRGTRWWLG